MKKLFNLLRFHLDKLFIYTAPLMFFSYGYFLLFEDFSFFNLIIFILVPFFQQSFIFTYLKNSNQKLLWTDINQQKSLYLMGSSFLIVRWVAIPLTIVTGIEIYETQANFGTILWLQFFYFYLVGGTLSYLGTGLLYLSHYREYKPFKNIINPSFLLKLLPVKYLFRPIIFISFGLIQWALLIQRPKILGGGVAEVKKIDQKLKIQLTKELLETNGRLSYFNTEEEFIKTPEFTIVSIVDFIRWAFTEGMTLAPAIHNAHIHLNWLFLRKNSDILYWRRNSDEEQRFKEWKSKINAMQTEVDALILQAQGSVDDANNSTYEYIKIMIAIEHQGEISEAQITENIDHITIRFKDLGLMI